MTRNTYIFFRVNGCVKWVADNLYIEVLRSAMYIFPGLNSKAGLRCYSRMCKTPIAALQDSWFVNNNIL